MSKRRTRAQKEKANRQFSIYLQSEPEKIRYEPAVKRQFKKVITKKTSKISKIKNAVPTAKLKGLGSIKRDLIKSLILASLILGTELVLYLAWSR